jgi:uncharacterized protein (TIGR00725 family)
MEKRRYIGVIGSGDDVPQDVLDAAEEVGRGVAEAGCVLICGGRGGVMQAACRGAKAAGGLTVGILPGLDREDANPYVDVAIPTGLGFALRNAIIVRSSDALVMLRGEVGTLSEAVLAYQHGKPLVAIEPTGGWAGRLRSAALEDGSYLDGRKLVRLRYAATPAEGVRLAVELIGTGRMPPIV